MFMRITRKRPNDEPVMVNGGGWVMGNEYYVSGCQGLV